MKSFRDELAEPETQAPALDQINSDLNEIGHGLQEAAMRLWNLHDRLLGPSAMNKLGSCSESKPSGLIGKLNSSVSTLRGLTDDLHALASELERVA